MDRYNQCKLEASAYLARVSSIVTIAQDNVVAFPELARSRIREARAALELAEARLEEADAQVEGVRS